MKEIKIIKLNILYDKRIKVFIYVFVYEILFKKVYDISYYVLWVCVIC